MLLVCDFAEKNATRSDMKEEVGAALGTSPRPPFAEGFHGEER
jgi:hypothetical protein